MEPAFLSNASKSMYQPDAGKKPLYAEVAPDRMAPPTSLPDQIIRVIHDPAGAYDEVMRGIARGCLITLAAHEGVLAVSSVGEMIGASLGTLVAPGAGTTTGALIGGIGGKIIGLIGGAAIGEKLAESVRTPG